MFLLKPKNIIKFLCHSALVFSIILILLINSFPWFLNISYIQNKLFQTVTKQTQLSISSNDIDLDLFPTPALRIKNLNIESEGRIACNIQTLLIYPDSKELFKRNLILNKLAIFDINLNLNLESNLLSKSSDNTSSSIAKVSNFLQTKKIDKFIHKENGLSILIKNFHYDFAEKFDAAIKVKRDNKITGNLSITNFDLNKELLKKYNVDKNIFNLNSQPAKNQIQFKHLKANFNITNYKTKISVTPTIFQYPSMTLGITFLHDKKFNKTQLEFSGQNVNIDQAKRAYFDLFNKEAVSENLFDIVRAGNASNITVLFNDKKLENILSPENMILNGQLENGDIKIPNTPLIPKKVFGTAFIKNGILYIKAEKGRLKSSTFSDGILKIDLLNYNDYPFNGSFKIHAPLIDIKNILSELFNETLLSKELKLIKDVNGIVDGELLLELNPGDDLNVTVLINDVTGSGEYLRAPGKIKINMGKFFYENDIITLTDFAGKIGKSYFYNFTGSYNLNNTRLLDIISGGALVDSHEVFNWLIGFQPIKDFVPDLNIEQGFLKIDSTNIKGDILEPNELKFDVHGEFKQNIIIQNSIKQNLVSQNKASKEIELSSCDFQISDRGLAFKNIYALISDMEIISNFTDNTEIKSIVTPMALTNASYSTKECIDSFSGTLYFPTGPEIELFCQCSNNNSFSIKKLKITDGSYTDAIFDTGKDNNIDFFKFKGQICTKTFEKIFNQESSQYQNIIAYTDKKKIIIKSNKESVYSISAEAIDLDHFIKNLFSKHKNTLFSEKKDAADTFPNKLITIETDSLIYKQSDFKNSKAGISVKKNKNGLNGKLKFKSKDGKIHSLTLLSRILSVINISTLFKGKLPDIKQEGFKYHSINFKADIINNIIVLDEVVIDGHDMALVFQGTIDPAKNDLDLICLVAPFKTIDMLIEKIPLISTMLNNNLISIPVKISGKINDPTVVALHPVAVGKGIINLMTNIIKTPIKLWEKLPTKKKSEDIAP
ncbi:MAG: AsmA-like C-terminal domain-containing protein [Desulfobacteraceae bacterium]|nr:AsmA-like C-terminal domain-containing protein [Desulfobacteraceae bacterium]